MLKISFLIHLGFYLTLMSVPATSATQVNALTLNSEQELNNCIRLKAINLDEYQLFTLEQQQSLLHPYLGRCISAEMIKTIVTEVDSFYTNHGYITTKPYLKPQDINSGAIKINVVTGIIQNIVNSKTQKVDGKIATAFIHQNNSPLNLQDIETALEMINRVLSVDAKFKIKPSKQIGKSVIEVDTTESSPYHFSFGVNGEGDLNDENPDLNAVFSIDNLLGINDILSITINGSMLQQKYQGTKGSEYNYSFPIGSYLIDFTGADISYRKGAVGLNSKTYLANGNTESKRLKISKILARDKRNKYQLLFSIYHKDTKNYAANVPLDVSSYKTTLAQVDFIHTHSQNRWQLINTYSYYQGVDWFGARDDNYISAEPDLINLATLEFKKFGIASKWLYYFQDRDYSLNSNFRLQYTKDNLYDNDKKTVGGSGTVRGYSASNLFGNNAWYVRNNLSKSIALNWHPKLLKTITPFIGLDYGKVRCESDNNSNCGEIAGSAIGFHTDSNNLSTTLTWSYPLKDLGQDFKKEPLFVFSANWKY